jgi:hypothetical protein
MRWVACSSFCWASRADCAVMRPPVFHAAGTSVPCLACAIRLSRGGCVVAEMSSHDVPERVCLDNVCIAPALTPLCWWGLCTILRGLAVRV